MTTDFNQLASRSHLERIEDAVVEALSFDQEMSSFCSWYRVTDPETWPDLPTPYGVVVTTFSEGKFQLTMEEEMKVTVQIGVAYDELRDVLSPGDKGIHSVENSILRVLRDPRNSHLGAGIGPGIVDRLVSFLGTSYGAISFARGEEDEEETFGSAVMLLGVEYVYTIGPDREPV